MNWTLLLNSGLVAAGTALAACCLGTAAACACRCVDARFRPAWILAAIVCLALPPFLVVNAWIDRFGAVGPWRDWLPFPIYSRAGVILVLGLWTWPISFLFVMGAWNNLTRALPDSEPDLRGRWFIRHVLIPGAKPALAPALILTAALAFNQFSVPAILQVPVFPVELWIHFSTEFNYRDAVALSWPMLVLPLTVLILARRIVARRPEPAPGGPIRSNQLRRHLGRGPLMILAIFMPALWVLSLGFPGWQLAESSRTWSELPAALAASRSAVLYSFLYAAATGVLVVITGIALLRFRAGHVLWVFFLFPGVGLGIAALYLLNRPEPVWLGVLYPSVGLAIALLTLRHAAIGHFGAWRARGLFNPDLADAARMDGANRWQIFRHAQAPRAMPIWIATGYVTYVICLWDVETILMIEPPGTQTLAMRIFNLLHYGHNDQVNALCLVLIGLAVAPLALWLVLRRIGRRFQPSRPRRSPRSDRSARIGISTAAAAGTLCVALCAGCSSGIPGVEGSSSSGAIRRPLDSEIFEAVQVIGKRGNGAGQFQKPRSLVVDRRGDLFVSDMTGRIQRFDAEGRFITAWQMPEIDRGRPKGMACDSLGRIVVVEPHYARVNHFTPEGDLVLQWGRHGTNLTQLAFPRSAAIGADGEIFISEFGVCERIQCFSRDGSRGLNGWGAPGIGPGEFNRPEGLAFREGRLFVADSCNHRIQVFNGEGRFLRAYGTAGNGPGNMSYPYDIAVDEVGLQFVCEFGNSRIQVFDRRDRVVEVIGEPGSAPGQFHNPWSVALDGRGNLYVADSANHRVQKLLRRDPFPDRPADRDDTERTTARGGTGGDGSRASLDSKRNPGAGDRRSRPVLPRAIGAGFAIHARP